MRGASIIRGVSNIGLLAAALIATPPSVGAQTLQQALLDGRVTLDGRYRFEHVDQDGFASRARASTVRTRLGYETRNFEGFFAFVEIENVSAIGNEAYDDTIEGRTRFPVVADPETTAINRALLTVDRLPATLLRIGRQRIVLDNQRFLGNVNFRQIEQTFDAVMAENRSFNDVVATYVYIANANRVFGDDSPVGDFDSDSHLLNVAYDGWRVGQLTLYGYLIEIENAQAFSSRTFGARFAGSHRFRFNRDLGLAYALEFAHQRDHAGNPADYSDTYVLIEPGLIVGNLFAGIGFERLGGDGVDSVQTPLATLHAFNGVTDRFLVTPAVGLDDRYAKATFVIDDPAPFDTLTISGAYHDFQSDSGDLDLGSEWSLKATLDLDAHFTLSIEYADFDAGLVSTDTRVTWSALGFRF